MEMKEILKKAKSGMKHFLRLRFKKYIIVVVLGVLLVGFLGDNSVVGHIKNKKRIDELKAEIAHYSALTKSNLEQVDQLLNDPKAVEKVARERYFMKTDNEDVFVLSDDPVDQENIVEDETVE